jgi:hypothetical protein
MANIQADVVEIPTNRGMARKTKRILFITLVKNSMP